MSDREYYVKLAVRGGVTVTADTAQEAKELAQATWSDDLEAFTESVAVVSVRREWERES